MKPAPDSYTDRPPSWGDMWAAFGRIGVLSFGGPAAQIALMHNTLVDEKKWLTEKQYLSALSFCMLLPGPEAMQLATYAGWKLKGIPGGLLAGSLFVLPGAFIILALAITYAFFGSTDLLAVLFSGIKAAVIVIVLDALLKVAKRALKGAGDWIVAGLAFVGIFFLSLPFPLIIFAAALYGFFTSTAAPHRAVAPPAAGSFLRTAVIIVAGLAAWWLPVAVAFLSGADLLTELGLFFSKLAVVTFGGAYAVLAYMAQDIISHYQWLTAGEMMDGLGLAETTPGPLILVTEFTGFLAAFKEGGLWLGILGAAMTLWVTFIPCFIWIFAGAPHIEQLQARPRLSGALNAITAAVVGVILNLSIWFGLHVFFQDVERAGTGVFTLWIPDVMTLDVRVALLAVLSGFLLFARKWPVIKLLGAVCAAGLVLSWF